MSAFASLTTQQRHTRRRILEVLRTSLRRTSTLTGRTRATARQTHAVVLSMYLDGELSLHWAVYHSCSKRRVALRVWSDGFQPTPWVCDRCEKIAQADDLLYELLVRKEKTGG